MIYQTHINEMAIQIASTSRTEPCLVANIRADDVEEVFDRVVGNERW